MCCFFFKQKTAYEMHISDWSSDVCSSDLSLYAALEASGVFPVSGTQRICAALATPTEAGMLSIAQSSEILRIERLTRDAKGTPVEFTRSAYRGDRYEFVTDIAANAAPKSRRDYAGLS